MTINRCVCFNITFAQMREYVDQHGGGEKELQARFGCGRGCALCIPYIRAMLRTGKTAFSADPAALERLDPLEGDHPVS